MRPSWRRRWDVAFWGIVDGAEDRQKSTRNAALIALPDVRTRYIRESWTVEQPPPLNVYVRDAGVVWSRLRAARQPFADVVSSTSIFADFVF